MSIDSTSVLPGVGAWLLRRRMARPPALVSTRSKPVWPCSSVFVALLQAELADVFGALVVGQLLVRPVLHLRLLGLVDAADVAQQVAAGLAQRIVAEQPRLHVHAGVAEALRHEARHLLVAELGADRQRIEALAFFEQPLEAAPVAHADLDDLGQAVDGGFQVVDLRRRDLQRVGRVVGGQHLAVAVEDAAAVGHDRQHRGAVGLGLRRQVLVAHHLQVRTAARPAAQSPAARRRRPRARAAGSDPARLRGSCSSAITGVDSGPDRAGGAAAPAATR